jgi:hypothetical protein
MSTPFNAHRYKSNHQKETSPNTSSPLLHPRIRPHNHTRRAITILPLDRHKHIIMFPQLQPGLVPRLEMIPRRHGPAGLLHVSDTPELGERRRTLDGWFILANFRPDLVFPIVGSEVSLERRFRVVGGIMCTVGFDNVVFDERRGGPAVDGEIGVSLGKECRGVVYCSGRRGLGIVLPGG